MVLERTTGGFVASSDGKSKMRDNLARAAASKTDERPLTEDLIRQAVSNFKPTVVSIASFDGDYIYCYHIRL